MKDYLSIIEGDGICIHFNNGNIELAKEYFDHIKNVIKRINKEYEFNNFIHSSSLQIYLCDNIEDYLYHTGKELDDYQEWMVGWAEGFKICILLAKTCNKSDEYMLSVLTHEVIHVLFDENIDGSGPLWILEGIAILLSNQTCNQYVDIEKPCLIKDISNENEMNFATRGGYDYAGIYVWYFIQKFEVKVFKNAYAGKIDFLKYVDKGYEYEAISKWLQKE